MSLERVCHEREQDQHILTEMIIFLLRCGYVPEGMSKGHAKTWRKQVIEGIRIAREAWQPQRWSFYCELPLRVGVMEFYELGWP